MLSYLVSLFILAFCVFRMYSSYQPSSQTAEFIGNTLVFGPIALLALLYLLFLYSTSTHRIRR